MQPGNPIWVPGNITQYLPGTTVILNPINSSAQHFHFCPGRKYVKMGNLGKFQLKKIITLIIWDILFHAKSQAYMLPESGLKVCGDGGCVNLF